MLKTLTLAFVAMTAFSGLAQADVVSRTMRIHPDNRNFGNQCLTVEGNSTQRGARVLPGPCSQVQADKSAWGQQWLAIPLEQKLGANFNTYILVNKNSGMCLDAGVGQGVDVVQWDCHFAPSQRFAVNGVAYGWSHFMTGRDLSCLTITPQPGMASPKVTTRPCSSGSDQGILTDKMNF